MCLKDAIQYLANGVDGVSELLLRPGDTQAYTHTFLCSTMVAFEAPPPARQQAWRLSQRFSQEQVIARLVLPAAAACFSTAACSPADGQHRQQQTLHLLSTHKHSLAACTTNRTTTQHTSHP
jgi:hypothetical protein